ncbi:late competence development ComFB family protein [Nostocaceae cyanobacterium CENA357]|uniref:Late competence development ComFB family protein n=1 Tax=Atlanticothrix silvestris CENA357 TaxID=1725252 RepID=A0A8J7HKJ5_9CYAN|nr:late competence development ComFB family protein [Atlanticothrix silvestris]MBH8554388.1 late competence development ComFB family protein [Atlanticothrix silvestris CENA357]
MSKTLINITIPVVIKEIEDVLVTYPHHPYQETFAHPDFRQSLMAYFLNKIPNQYITVDEEKKYFYTHLENSLHIEAIIHQGIEEILCEQAQEINRHIPEVVDPRRVASSWFG